MSNTQISGPDPERTCTACGAKPALANPCYSICEDCWRAAVGQVPINSRVHIPKKSLRRRGMARREEE
jgi:hypothetical protein